LAIADAAILAATPSTIVRLSAGRFDVIPPGKTFLLAIGKAAPAMAAAFVDARPGLLVDGLVVGSHLADSLSAPLRWQPADHPVPGARSLAGGRAALDLARTVGPLDTLVVLVSGGASALMTLPVPNVTLEDKQQVTRRLMAAGADIRALNTVRKHLSAIKGGRLAAACAGRVIAWLLSDVVGDDPAVIGSGPTVADHSTFADALATIEQYGGRGAFPDSVVVHLERGAAGLEQETPKPGSALFERVATTVIGSARLSLEGAAGAARALGYSVKTRGEPVIGEARVAASDHLMWVESMLQTGTGRTCLLSYGETTVTVTGDGKGGRNQEFVLALVTALARRGGPLMIASVGTDGIDGPTDAAGALADETTLDRGVALGLSASRALDANDAWTFFSGLRDLIVTGPTGTNVGDIQIVLGEGTLRL
jgi:glycerate 2-kinase